MSRGLLKSKGGGKIINTLLCRCETDETVFRTIISVNQVSIYGAVSDMSKECNVCKEGKDRLVVTGQSNPLFVQSVMETPTTSTDDPAQEDDLLQRYQERFEKLSQQHRLNVVLMQIPDHIGSLTVFHDERH